MTAPQIDVVGKPPMAAGDSVSVMVQSTVRAELRAMRRMIDTPSNTEPEAPTALLVIFTRLYRLPTVSRAYGLANDFNGTIGVDALIPH